MKTLEDIIKEAAKSRTARKTEQAPAAETKKQNERAKVKDTSADPTAPIGPPPPPNDKGSANKQNVQPKENSVRAVIAPGELSSIIEMQEAIITFGNAAASIDAFKMAPQGTTGAENKQTGEYLGGHDAVSQFLFSNYMEPGKDKAGQSFVSTEGLNTKTRMDTANSKQDLNSLRAWVNTIQIIGRNDQKKPDGLWGARTNNALKAIVDFSDMFLKFSQDMGVQVKSADSKDVQDLRSKIPSITVGQTYQNGSVAKTITPVIVKLTTAVNEFKSSIMENATWKDYLSQTKPLLTAPKKQTELSGTDQATLKLYDSVPFNLGQFKAITLNDLSSVDKFISYLKKNKLELSSSKDLIDLVGKLKGGLQAQLEQAQKREDSIK